MILFKGAKRYGCIVFIFTVLFSASLVHLCAEEQADSFYKSITQDKVVQAEIEQLVSSMFSTSDPLFSKEELQLQTLSEEEFWTRVIDKFKLSTGKKVDELLLQVLLSWGGKLEHRENPEAEETKRALIFHLTQEIPEQELIFLIAPHLEKTTEPVLKKNLKQVLALVAFKSFKDNAPIDFVEFDSYLKERKDVPLYSLVEFMYQVDTEKAAVAMARVYEGEVAANELTSELKTKDVEILKNLSMSNKWWENLYVAVTMRKSRGYKDPAIIERLEKSKHPLVQKTLSEF